MRRSADEIQAGGTTLYGRRWLPEGEPIAAVGLVHGLGEHGGRYDHVAAALTAAGYAVFAFDLRGHGRSGGRRGDTRFGPCMDDIDRLLADAADAVPGKPRFLYGHSLGGLLVLTYGLRRRATALAGIVSSGAALRSPLREQRMKVTAARLLAPVVPWLTMPTGLDSDLISRDPAVVSAYCADALVHDQASVAFARDAIAAGDAGLAGAGSFTTPSLILHGGADRLTLPEGSRRFAGAAPGDCRLIVYDGLYHEIHNEPEQGEVLADIVAWLDGHRKI
jgi:alpha-beta hydrolase superfamily lysophospholipase